MAFLVPGSSTNALNAPSCLSATRDPSPTDDNSCGFQVMSMWINVKTSVLWICLNAVTGYAIWQKFNPYLPNLQMFIGPGTYAYQKPPNTKEIHIRGCAPGGGGGSGYCGNTLGTYYGGGGGQSGNAIDAFFPVNNLTGDVFTFTIPAAGVGGASQTTVGQSGNNGTAGGDININSNGLQTYIPGGAGGTGGGNVIGTGLGGVAALITTMVGAAGATVTTGVPPAGNSSTTLAGGGGGAGGTVQAGIAGAGSSGGNGSHTYGNQPGGAGGAANTAGSPGNGVTACMPGGGSGGGGGAGSSSGAGKPGGNGGSYAAGGGGGGATSAGSVGSGKGGDGAPGMLIFTSIG